MNWVEYLKGNQHITDPYDARQVRNAARLAAASMKHDYGWDNYTVQCTRTSLYFAYTKGSDLYTAFIPVAQIVKSLVIRPLLEKVVKMHEGKDTYRKSSRKK